MCSTGRSISPGWLRSRYPLVKFSNNFTACRQYSAEARVSTINEERPTPSLAEKFDPSLTSYALNLSYANHRKNRGHIIMEIHFMHGRFVVLYITDVIRS